MTTSEEHTTRRERLTGETGSVDAPRHHESAPASGESADPLLGSQADPARNRGRTGEHDRLDDTGRTGERDRTDRDRTAGDRTAGDRDLADRTAGDRTAGDRDLADRTAGHDRTDQRDRTADGDPAGGRDLADGRDRTSARRSTTTPAQTGADHSAPTATASGDTATATPSDADTERNPLVSRDRVDEYTSRWNAVKGMFVDEPRQAVQQADGLVGELLDDLERLFHEQRRQLEQGLDHDGTSTEDLRLALRRYRSFFDRLLSV